MADSRLNATVSGSFRRAMGAVEQAVYELTDAGVRVLSPADPRVVDQFGDFLFVASDRVRHIRTVQGRHLAAITASDLIWLAAPEGYVGQSAAMEIGYAAASQVPVFSNEVPSDLTLRQWVTVIPGIADAIGQVRHGRSTGGPPRRSGKQGAVLLDPAAALEKSHDDLVIAKAGLTGYPSSSQTDEANLAMSRVVERLTLP